MSDNFDNNSYNYENRNSSETPYSTNKPMNTEQNESSYEWNSDAAHRNNPSNEYHYSYINGNNSNAEHNPNNYENVYSKFSTKNSESVTSSNDYSNTSADSYTNTSADSYANTSNGSRDAYSNTASQNQYDGSYANSNPYQDYNSYQSGGNVYSAATNKKSKKVKVKKDKKPASKGFVAAMLIIGILASSAVGFGGGYFASQISSSGGKGGININQVSSSGGTTVSNASANGTTTEIVKKTADSVVEIATESVVTGGFAQQYVQQGAGSGVIISEDGYIITNQHVIDGAENIQVTLRDGTKSYTAALIGSDQENDIALLKVDAKGLSPATFGNSSEIAVGDYVVAIGNPLGELGGTVTDGIVSALAREVTIEGNNMTLLQHNAQISPGNSGGGLFNADGELIGIVNAKDSATEVEGIAFAIPINNVLDIIEDLQNYGYVTGKVDLGMQFTDITSRDTAFFYGVNKTGCYVVSVTKDSNADTAGFRAGDLITKVNGTDVSTSADIEAVLKDAKVGDKVDFTVYRSGRTANIELTLDEYTPTGNASPKSGGQQEYRDEDIWSDMFG